MQPRVRGYPGERVTVADVSRLPPPITTLWDWQIRAACRNIESTTFFHPEHERGPAKAERDNRAKAICSGCPVVQACLHHALAVQEPYGVWGGLTVTERAAMHHRDRLAASDLVNHTTVIQPTEARRHG